MRDGRLSKKEGRDAISTPPIISTDSWTAVTHPRPVLQYNSSTPLETKHSQWHQHSSTTVVLSKCVLLYCCTESENKNIRLSYFFVITKTPPQRPLHGCWMNARIFFSLYRPAMALQRRNTLQNVTKSYRDRNAATNASPSLTPSKQRSSPRPQPVRPPRWRPRVPRQSPSLSRTQGCQASGR